MDDWRSIVSAYTNPPLSKFTNLIIAVNGLAKFLFQARRHQEDDQYLAGL